MFNWPTKKLEEVADIIVGKTPACDDYLNEGIFKVLKYRDISQNKINWENNEKGFVKENRLNGLKEVKEGDILITSAGHTPDKIGEDAAIVREIPNRFKKVFFVSELICYRPKKSLLLSEWLLFFLNSKEGQKQIKKIVGDSVHLTGTKSKNLKIPLPPLSEQKHIVKKIEKLFSKIDEAEKLRKEAIEDTENLLKSAMQEVFERGGKGWQVRRVEDCIQRKNKKIKGVTKKKYQKSGKFPVIDQGRELIAGYIDNHSVIFKNPLPVIVFGDHTRTVKYINFPFAIGADGTKILIPIDNVYPKYFYYALSSLNIPSLGYSRHFKILKSQQIPIPSLSKQKQIVAYLDSLSEKIRQLKELQNQTAHELSLLRQSVLDKVFKGRL